MELAEFIKTALITVSLLFPFTMSLTSLWGKLGAKGLVQTLTALATGLVLGGWFMYIQVVPEDLSEWTMVVFTGLVEGLGAVGVYEVGKAAVQKGTEVALAKFKAEG